MQILRGFYFTFLSSLYPDIYFSYVLTQFRSCCYSDLAFGKLLLASQTPVSLATYLSQWQLFSFVFRFLFINVIARSLCVDRNKFGGSHK